jgi:hypothetical protein
MPLVTPPVLVPALAHTPAMTQTALTLPIFPLSQCEHRRPASSVSVLQTASPATAKPTPKQPGQAGQRVHHDLWSAGGAGGEQQTFR